ncbi:MAG: hypothetical protein OXH13_00535 [Chloroflexi bacterium]|nr:hypothetical protein [Chloroflexota bacterium]MCY3697121.1 hypothetical protein [Chloroflexota bacterium]
MQVDFHIHRAASIAGGGGLRLTALGLLLVLAVFLLGSATALAQTKLVGNLDHSGVIGCGFGNLNCAQRFTTGSNSAGYTLTRVDVKMDQGVTATPTHTVGIYGGTTSQPDLTDRKGALSAPASYPAGEVTQQYPASGNGIALAATTNYWLVFTITSGGTGSQYASGVTANSEDSDSLSGWHIADVHHLRRHGDTAFSAHASRSLIIGLYGHLGPPRSAAMSPDPSNLARSDVQWEPAGGMQPVPARIGEISANRPADASGSLDLRAIAASVSEELRAHSRGFYLTVLVESEAGQRRLLRELAYERAQDAPLLKVSIWHVYRHVGRGMNTVQLLGEVFVGQAADRLAEPVEICLPAPAEDAERARIAVRGRTDPDWAILETRLTDDGQLCAETTRVAWFTIVLEPASEPQDA